MRATGFSRGRSFHIPGVRKNIPLRGAEKIQIQKALDGFQLWISVSVIHPPGCQIPASAGWNTPSPHLKQGWNTRVRYSTGLFHLRGLRGCLWMEGNHIKAGDTTNRLCGSLQGDKFFGTSLQRAGCMERIHCTEIQICGQF